MDETIPQLSVIDYVVFAISLGLSALIGFYYYCSGGKQRTNKEYLHANKSMGVGPVAISLMASFMSAITLLGVPAENYNYGTQFVAINISYVIGTPLAAYVFIPVFYNLNLTSAYEYLELRFNRSVRISASLVFMVQMTLYMGIVLYAPALALSAVTGISKWASIIAVGFVCTLYSTTGGIKAILWTDVLQSFLMFAAVIAVAIRGVVLVGGLEEVYKRALDGNRIQFWNFDPDPTIRHSIWTLAFGGIFIYVSLYGVNQTQVQRLQTVGTLRKAQLALWLSWPVTTALSLITSFTGIVMYAYFKDCDPVLSGQIDKMDQLLPYFMMKTLSTMPGVPGLFIAGIFSGALSSVSSFVNSLAAVCLEDYIKPLRKVPLSPERETLVTKILAFVFGIVCVALTVLVEQMSGILQASLTIFGVVGGPMLALFTLGMCSRRCTATAALLSFYLSLALGFWIGFGALATLPQPPPLIRTVDSCPASMVRNLTSSISIMNDDDEPFFLYKLSYMYYAFVTWAFSIIFALLVSYTCGVAPNVDELLISPVFGGGQTHPVDSSHELSNLKGEGDVEGEHRDLNVPVKAVFSVSV